METILLVENDPANLVALALILRSFGYAVLEAGSQDEAVHACHEHQGPIHLVVTKAVLNSEASTEVVARLKLLNGQIRALFLSDEPPSELANKSMSYEYAFLQKPIRADVLARTIRGLLGGPQSSGPPSIS
jgi:two-component system, cell cycle sensor histidine kinase and response regulator CckA